MLPAASGYVALPLVSKPVEKEINTLSKVHDMFVKHTYTKACQAVLTCLSVPQVHTSGSQQHNCRMCVRRPLVLNSLLSSKTFERYVKATNVFLSSLFDVVAYVLLPPSQQQQLVQHLEARTASSHGQSTRIIHPYGLRAAGVSRGARDCRVCATTATAAAAASRLAHPSVIHAAA